jgi:uncharacterized membrane protein YvlD (DUF360 family)
MIIKNQEVVMRMLAKWVFAGLILYFFSYIGWFINIASIEAALILSFVVAVIHTLIRVLSGILVGAGCFTFGISLIPGIILGILGYPIALWKGQSFLEGVYIPSFLDAVVLSVVLSISMEIIQKIFFGKEK